MPKRAVNLEDLLRFELAGETQISPDGRRVCFTVKRTDAEKNKYYTRLWMADVERGESRPFTVDKRGDGMPRWSPDGSRVAFVSDREEKKSQIHLIPADGGEAEALTTLEEGGIHEMAWSPSGDKIAFVFRMTPAIYREGVRKGREDRGESFPVRVHTKLFYRLDGVGYFDGSYGQIWVVDVKSKEAKQLTNEPHHLGGLAWSPDGRTIGFIMNRREDDDLEPNYEDIWTIPAEGGALRRVPSPVGPKYGLSWSPDGKWLAWIGHTDPFESWGGKNQRVLIMPAEGAEEARDLTGETDITVGYETLADMHEVGGGESLQWSPDSQTLYFPLSAHGDTRLYRIGVDGSGLTPLTATDREMGSFSISRDGRSFGILLGSGTEAYDAYAGKLGGGKELELRRVSSLNRDALTEVEFQTPETFELPNGEGGTVHGWILRPTGFDASREYPAVVYVHGGPAAQYGGLAAPFHELQWLAANGYVVLFSNPRGSRGYGEAHTSAIRGDWGNRDWQDVQTVADHGAALDYVDGSRMAIMGGSYGGYMTAWAVGHTDRFRCAITDRLVNNLHSFAGTVDFPWQHGRAWKGNAWDDPSDLWRCSPLAFAGRINTPLLIIHSDGDLRCPISQAEELFAALRAQRKAVEFVRYPKESSHGMSRNGPPDLRLDRLRRNLGWLDKYLKD